MTTLIGKFQETNKRLQQLTVWRPTECDPYFELDRWRTDAHRTIEQIYQKKRQQIEQLTDKHEREFMRQIARQRGLLTSVRTRLSPPKDTESYIYTQNEPSILTDLQKIENDINTKLGRAEIDIETKPLNVEDTVIVSLKRYLSPTSSLYVKEQSTINQSKKCTPRSTNEVSREYDKWLQVKKQRRDNSRSKRSAKCERISKESRRKSFEQTEEKYRSIS